MSGPRFYTRDEVVVHNEQRDFWAIINERVIDLTNLYDEGCNLTDNHKLLLCYAGKDVSSFFHEDGTPIYRINQYGDSLPVFLPVLISDWWRDEAIVIGKVTALQRTVRVINTLTHKTIKFSVCEEDSIEDIKRKLSETLNYNTDDYVWRQNLWIDNGRLDMQKTLKENGLPHEENEKLDLPPALWLFHKF